MNYWQFLHNFFFFVCFLLYVVLDFNPECIILYLCKLVKKYICSSSMVTIKLIKRKTQVLHMSGIRYLPSSALVVEDHSLPEALWIFKITKKEIGVCQTIYCGLRIVITLSCIQNVFSFLLLLLSILVVKYLGMDIAGLYRFIMHIMQCWELHRGRFGVLTAHLSVLSYTFLCCYNGIKVNPL